MRKTTGGPFGPPPSGARVNDLKLGSTRLGLARVRLDLAWGSTIESGHIARIVTRGSTRLSLKLSFAWLKDLIGTAQVSDLLEQSSMLRNRLGFIRDLG